MWMDLAVPVMDRQARLAAVLSTLNLPQDLDDALSSTDMRP